jgi:4-hydroxy-tetrahydrodipicolinate synthase
MTSRHLRRGEQFSGVGVAMITPFKRNLEIDFNRVCDNTIWLIDHGVDFLVPCGTTGESPTLSHEEQIQIIRTVCSKAFPRGIPVLAGTGSNSTAEAIELTRRASEAGADGAMLVTPYYNKPGQSDIVDHFRTVAEACPGVPIVVYNIAGRTGVNITPDTFELLAEIPAIMGVKEASGSLDQVSGILRRTDLTVLSGDDTLTLPMLSVGASGVISVVANIVPSDVKDLVRSLDEDLNSAIATHHKLFPLASALLTLASNPKPIKAAMALLERDSGVLRRPLRPLQESETEILKQVLREYGLL